MYMYKANKPASVNQVVKIECGEMHLACIESPDAITINTAKMNNSILYHADVSVIRSVMEMAMQAK